MISKRTKFLIAVTIQLAIIFGIVVFNLSIIGNGTKVLLKIEDNSVDLVLTDPPYFLDKMDNNWRDKAVSLIVL